MSAAAERSLFATKGRAVPNGGLAAAQPAPANPPAVTACGIAADPAQPALPLGHAAAPDAPVSEGRSPQGDGAPIGSLLDFRLRRGAGVIALAEDVSRALGPSATPPDDVANTITSPAAAENAGTPLEPGLPAAAAAIEVSEVRPGEPAPAAMPKEKPGEPASTRLDRPLFPQAPERPGIDVAHADEPVTTPVRNAYAPPRTSTARTVLPAAAAVVAIAVVGWLIADSEPGQEPPSPGASMEMATPSRAERDTALVPADAVAVATAPAMPEATTEDPARVASPAAAPSTDAAPAAMAEPAPPAMPPAVSPLAAPWAETPTLDVVRVEPGAAPVLAGRAAPGAELIVLDNGVLLGTTTADNNGEWALVSQVPLPPGRHELSLALKTPDGAVVIEQADTEAVPAPDSAAGAEELPVPPAKPVPGAAAEKLYVVQLASVASVGDAEREWRRLQQAYPALLGSREVEINAAEIGGRGTFYRLRTGPFADREAARLLCRELNTAGQECLVVRAVAD